MKRKPTQKNKAAAPLTAANPVKAPLTEEKKVPVFWRKLLLALVGIFGLVWISDSIGLFESDDPNFHAKKNWDEFYEFTKTNEVDILLVGNSHLYTGINPQNLSCALGATSFILAAPGTYVADAYYCLEEALTRTTPKVVVVETYGINNFDPHTFTKSSLSDQVKSFDSRQNKWLKLKSTPALFSWDNYLYAWSPTIRNHDFIWSKPKVLGKNIRRGAAAVRAKEPGELPRFGRFVRFQEGIQERTLVKYALRGSPIAGRNFTYSESAKKYLEKMKILSQKHGFRLVFLTLPMYEKHIADYPAMKYKLGQIINPVSSDWLDLQQDYPMYDFSANCFEDTYKPNQHLTYLGSLKATYALAAWLNKLPVTLPNRARDPQWLGYFYRNMGYLENQPFKKSKPGDILLARNAAISGIRVKEAFVYLEQGSQELIVKFDKASISEEQSRQKILASFRGTSKGQPFILDIPLTQSAYWKPIHHYLFNTTLPAEAKVQQLLGISFVNPDM